MTESICQQTTISRIIFWVANGNGIIIQISQNGLVLENPGRLRLYTASVTDSLQKSRNMLTQRIFGYRDNTKPSYGTIRMNVSKMYDGDMAGLAVFQNPYAYIAVNKQGNTLNLVQSNTADKKVYSNPITCDSVIYLRAVADIATSKLRSITA
ncbi:MAG: hypothetical protein LKM34_06410 [Prevotella sp.]|jgi:beta-xylosidase|nr:hypothetical protein [Prevotella sp.]